jgi:hypothetical protein
MATGRAKLDNPDGIIAAGLVGTAGRYVSGKPLDVDAALAELREIAGSRADLHGNGALASTRGRSPSAGDSSP